MHRPLLLLGLLALTAACVDTTYATQPDVLHPGPCAVGGLTLRYDDRDRLVEVWETDGRLRERYTYEDDFTFTIEVNTTVRYDPTNSRENLDSVVSVEAKLYAHATIDPVTFEFLISRIDATLPAPYQAGSGQIFYTYTDDDEDGWIDRTSVSFPPGWRTGATFLEGDRPGTALFSSVDWIPEEVYVSRTGDETHRGDLLWTWDRQDTGGHLVDTSNCNIFKGMDIIPSCDYISGGLCSYGNYGLYSCDYSGISNDYSSSGNLIRSRSSPSYGQGYDIVYDYSCWTSDDICTKWRYVPSDRHVTSTSRYTLRHSLYFGIPSMIRMPCEWSWETAARLR